MTEHDEGRDDVIDVLRRARPEDLPDEVVSPHAPAAQALLEEILSMQTIPDPKTAEDAAVTRLTVPRWRRRAVVVGAVAAAAVAVVLSAGVVLDPFEPSAATAIEEALATSAQSLSRSGRAEIRREERFVREDGAQAFVQSTLSRWEYSDDDSQVFLVGSGFNGAIVEQPLDQAPINRYVDGELYLYIGRGAEPTLRWYRDVGGNLGDAGRFGIDPATLLGRLGSAGDFEEVGTETIDGVATRRLRAENPDRAPALRQGMDELGEVTKLEVWVDDDDLVRRVDFTYEGPDAAPPVTHEDGVPEVAISDASVSFRFFDFGEPITIEAPTEFEDIAPVG
jgi:hypothetical protein